MWLDVCLRSLLLLAPAILWAASGVGPHIFLSLQSLQQLDTLSSHRIESLDDATAYVRGAAALYGVTDSAPIHEGLESRFAAAELEAAKDPNKLVSDERIAEAFNFLCDKLSVAPARVTAADILLYRSVQASIFPHAFSPKSINGSRPVGAVVMLSQLMYNGGITEGVRKAAQLDRPPGSLKVTDGHVVGRSCVDRNPSLVAREYQTASLTYFAQRSPQEVRSFLERLAGILDLPGGR